MSLPSGIDILQSELALELVPNKKRDRRPSETRAAHRRKMDRWLSLYGYTMNPCALISNWNGKEALFVHPSLYVQLLQLTKAQQ